MLAMGENRFSDSQEIHCALRVHKLFRAHLSLRFAYVLFDVRNPVGTVSLHTPSLSRFACCIYSLGLSDFCVADRSAVIVVRVRVCSGGVLNIHLLLTL